MHSLFSLCSFIARRAQRRTRDFEYFIGFLRRPPDWCGILLPAACLYNAGHGATHFKDEDLIAHSTLFISSPLPVYILLSFFLLLSNFVLYTCRGALRKEEARELWLVSPGHKVDRDEILKRVNVRRGAGDEALACCPIVEQTLYMRQVSAPSAYKYQNKRGDGFVAIWNERERERERRRTIEEKGKSIDK